MNLIGLYKLNLYLATCLMWPYFNVPLEGHIRPKIKFYLFTIAAQPTEKLATQIILFAFQTI
jgi:hypothetical protein